MKWTKVDNKEKVIDEPIIEEVYIMSHEEEIEILNRFDPTLLAYMIWKEEALDEQTEVYMMYTDY